MKNVFCLILTYICAGSLLTAVVTHNIIMGMLWIIAGAYVTSVSGFFIKTCKKTD